MNSIDTASTATVESIARGEFVRRKADGKVFIRGEYDRATRRFSLEDANDIGREVFVKRGTVLHIGFDY